MAFNCEICDYSTDYNSNFHKHKRTTKHINREKNSKYTLYKFVCELCEQRFPTNQKLQRHLNRKTPCIASNSIVHANKNSTHIATQNNNQIGTQNNNQIGTQIGTQNVVINNITYGVTDFSELKKLASCKDKKLYIDHIKQDVPDIIESQQLFDSVARYQLFMAEAEIKSKIYDEKIYAERMKNMGEEYEMEIFDINDAKIKLVDVISEIYFKGKHNLSLFKDPRPVETNAKWYCKHLNQAFDPEFIFQLVEGSEYRDRFDQQRDFDSLDKDVLTKAWETALGAFYKAIDKERNGYNLRNKKDRDRC